MGAYFVWVPIIPILQYFISSRVYHEIIFITCPWSALLYSNVVSVAVEWDWSERLSRMGCKYNFLRLWKWNYFRLFQPYLSCMPAVYVTDHKIEGLLLNSWIWSSSTNIQENLFDIIPWLKCQSVTPIQLRWSTQWLSVVRVLNYWAWYSQELMSSVKEHQTIIHYSGPILCQTWRLQNASYMVEVCSQLLC